MNVLVPKRQFEFWNHRDTRKEKFRPLKSFSLSNQLSLFESSSSIKTVKGFISNNILLPLKELPQSLLSKLQTDLLIRNPVFDKTRKYGKGFVPYSISEFIKLYSTDADCISIPRSIKRNYLEKQFSSCGLKLELVDIRPKFQKIRLVERGQISPLFYQKEAINKIIEDNVVIEFKCGRGKTFLTLMAVAKVRYRTLILVRTNIILNQWVQAIQQVFDIGIDKIGTINGKKKTEGLITIATEQSLVAMSREDKRRIGETYGHVIFDECHEVAAPQYRELLTYFKAKKVTGLSATPEREDGTTNIIKAYIGQIVKVDDLGELPTRIDVNTTDFDFVFDSAHKDTQYNELLNALIIDTRRNGQIVRKIIDYVDKGHYVMVHSKRVEHLKYLREMLVRLQPKIKTDVLVGTYDGKDLSIKEQNEAQRKFREGETQVLFGGQIIEQGFNVERVSVIVLATPTKSTRLIKQVMGRVQREYPGKKCAYLVDFFDSKVPVLRYQYFARNKKIYKNYKKV